MFKTPADKCFNMFIDLIKIDQRKTKDFKTKRGLGTKKRLLKRLMVLYARVMISNKSLKFLKEEIGEEETFGVLVRDKDSINSLFAEKQKLNESQMILMNDFWPNIITINNYQILIIIFK